MVDPVAPNAVIAYEREMFHRNVGINVLFGDGHVQMVRSSINGATMRALVTPNGGEVIANDY